MGTPVRVRLTAGVTLLAALGLIVAGLFVYLVEQRRLDDQAIAEAQQELDEFDKGVADTRNRGATLRATMRTVMERNVPDDDEILIAWIGDGPALQFPAADELTTDPAFREEVTPLVESGGTARLTTPLGEVVVASQPISQPDETGAVVSGAMLAVQLLDDDHADLLDTMRTYAIVAALSLLMLAGLAFSQAGRLLAPLRVLRRTAEEISETDLSRRLPVQGNDDITALTHTVNHMLERLETAFVGQRRLLDDAGHELRTPLTIMQGHLELLDAHAPVDVEETRELLLDEVDRMSRLVGDLILLAASERPDFLHPASVDVGDLTETVLAKATGLGDRTWIVDERPPGIARVVADEQRVTQALLQLAHNALKHTSESDTIAFGSAVDAHGALWWVRDTGSGVPEADRARIFERFGRARREQGTEGFGLGLSIVTAIARAHGGQVWLDADYRDGARFVIAVPFTAGALAPEPGRAEHPHDRDPQENPWPAS